MQASSFYVYMTEYGGWRKGEPRAAGTGRYKGEKVNLDIIIFTIYINVTQLKLNVANNQTLILISRPRPKLKKINFNIGFKYSKKPLGKKIQFI